MAQPTPYDRQFSFQDFQAQEPTTPLPGDEVDGELNAVKLTIDQTLVNLAKIQRDDGALKNGIVTQDALSDSLSIGFTLRGEWQSGVNYYLGDGVTVGSKFFRATASALSNAGNAPEQPDAPWVVVANFTAAAGDAEAARDAAEASATAAAGSASSASGFATAAAGSASAASGSETAAAGSATAADASADAAAASALEAANLIGGTVTEAVRWDVAQALSGSDKQRAQDNIGLSVFTGDSGIGGSKGLVPAPAPGDAADFRMLGASGGWEDVGAYPYLSARSGAVQQLLAGKLEDSFTVKQLGAVGDGVTDDAAAFNKIAAAGGVVHIPRGTYKLNSVVTLDAPVTVIIETGTVVNVTHDGAGIKVTSSGVSIVGLGLPEIIGPRTVAEEYLLGSNGIDLAGANAGAPLSDCEISGVRISDFKNGGIWSIHTDDLKVRGNEIRDCTYAGIMNLSAIRAVVSGNKVLNIKPGTNTGGTYNTAYGISFTRDNTGSITVSPASADCQCIGNYVNGVPSHEGLDTHGGSNCLFLGNSVYNVRVGINLNPAPGGGSTNSPVHNRVIGNNFFSNINGTDPCGEGVTCFGEAAAAAQNNLIQGNTFYGFGSFDAANTRPAAAISYTSECHLVDNTFHSCRWILIKVDNDNFGLRVSGNNFQSVAVVGGVGAVLNVGSTKNVMYISGNTFFKNTGTMTAYAFAAQDAGYAINIARDNVYHNVDTVYLGLSQSYRTDLGSTAA